MKKASIFESGIVGNLGNGRGYREGAALMGGEYIWGQCKHGTGTFCPWSELGADIKIIKICGAFFLLRRTTPISPTSPKLIPVFPKQKPLVLRLLFENTLSLYFPIASNHFHEEVL